MEVEYSNEIKGKVFAYRIMAHEKPIIIAAYKKHIIKLERAIEKVKTHPKNEGQVTYSEQIRELRGQVDELEYTIKLLSNG